MSATHNQAVEIQELRDKLVVQPPHSIEWVNGLVYSEPGAGKTWLLGTAEDHADTSPVLILDVEGGLTTLRHRKGIDTKPVRSMKEVEDTFNTLYKSIKTDPKTGKRSMYYKTVGIDQLTELAALDMRTIMNEAWSRNPDKIDKDVPSPREWGKCREHIRMIVRSFRDLPCNVIFTASLGKTQEEGQPTKYFPGFAGQLSIDVPGFMDIVGYMSTETQGDVVIRYMQLQQTRRVTAKDRTSALGARLENPSIPLMWDLIKNNNKSEKE